MVHSEPEWFISEKSLRTHRLVKQSFHIDTLMHCWNITTFCLHSRVAKSEVKYPTLTPTRSFQILRLGLPTLTFQKFTTSAPESHLFRNSDSDSRIRPLQNFRLLNIKGMKLGC